MIENFNNKQNTNGFDKNKNNINRAGRKPSLKKQLSNIVESDRWLTFNKEDVPIEKDTIQIKILKEQQLAISLIEIATGKNPTAAPAAIKLYLDTFDGKPRQSLFLNAAQKNDQQKEIKITVMDAKDNEIAD